VKLLSIEGGIFDWRPSDRKDTTGLETQARELDMMKEYQWTDYNLMTIKTIENREIKAAVVAKV
jgi:hypothetical protein